MGLGDPMKKMSKSDAAGENSIFLLDSLDAIRSKVMRATTDSLHEIRFDENRPGIHNLLTIYELFSGMSKTEIEVRFEGKGYAEFKQELADIIIENLKPLQFRYRELMTHPSCIERILMDGCGKVQPISENILSIVKKIWGWDGLETTYLMAGMCDARRPDTHSESVFNFDGMLHKERILQ